MQHVAERRAVGAGHLVDGGAVELRRLIGDLVAPLPVGALRPARLPSRSAVASPWRAPCPRLASASTGRRSGRANRRTRGRHALAASLAAGVAWWRRPYHCGIVLVRFDVLLRRAHRPSAGFAARPPSNRLAVTLRTPALHSGSRRQLRPVRSSRCGCVASIASSMLVALHSLPVLALVGESAHGRPT